MAVYRRGSVGPEVARFQARLGELGHYRGPIDGVFGGGTESAVRSFQRSAGVAIDGVVGPRTWAAAFAGEDAPRPAIVDRSLEYRCLALTGSFETGRGIPDCFAGVAGDFDGQGVSFGALQWNLGQRSLQPLLQEIDRLNPALLEEVFHDRCDELRAVLAVDPREQLAWARSIQDLNRRRLQEPWHGLFKALGRRPECQEAQARAARQRYERAIEMCRAYGVWSERAVALMFDVVVQNGSIGELVRAQLRRDFANIAPGPADEAEVARLRAIANRRAEAAKPQWVEDVRQRKLTIANGEGRVHGRRYHLENDYGIGLRPAEAPGVRAPAGALAGSRATRPGRRASTRPRR
jgi:hypothetical protein